jgi:hypothetical protein
MIQDPVLEEIREILLQMSSGEKASALHLLAAIVAEAEEYPSYGNPRVMSLAIRVATLSYQEQVNLIVIVGHSINHPEFLLTKSQQAQYAMN